jgi:hypothetical protein
VSSTLSLAVQLATTAYHRRLRCHGTARANAWLEQVADSRFAWFLLPAEKLELAALVAAAPSPLHFHPPTVYWAEAA